MNIYAPTSQPYTYLIGWTTHNKWYYGVRYSNHCSPSDLWDSYFTSSKYIQNLRKEFGEPDIVKIRKTFSSKEDAISWEGRVLKKLWPFRSNWINKRFTATKFVPNEISIGNNIRSKKCRPPEKQRLVRENISNGSKLGHQRMSEETKQIKSIKISEKNKSRSKSVNARISEKVKYISANRTVEEKSAIEAKKAETRRRNKELGISRKPRSHIILCSCICCKKVMNLGCFGNHTKRKSE